jgi:hypothetical protein
MAAGSVAHLKNLRLIAGKGKDDLSDLEDVVKSLMHTPPERNDRN